LKISVFDPEKEILQGDDGKKLLNETNEKKKMMKVKLQKEIQELSRLCSKISK